MQKQLESTKQLYFEKVERLYFLLLQFSTKHKEHPKSISNAFLQLQTAAKFSRPHIRQIQTLKLKYMYIHFFSFAQMNDFTPVNLCNCKKNLSTCLSIVPLYNCITERKIDVLGLQILMLLSRPHQIPFCKHLYPSPILPSYRLTIV